MYLRDWAWRKWFFGRWMLGLVLFGSFFSCAPEKRSPLEVDKTPLILPPEKGYFDHLSRFDTLFRGKTERGEFSGTVLIAQHGKVIFEGAYGYENWETKDTLKPTSLFQLASVSKTITATAVMLLVQEGEIRLTDTLRYFFPELPYANITIEQLLCHRHGLSNYMYFTDDHWENWNTPISNQEVITLLAENNPSPYWNPDYRYNYSNTGYMLLASVVSKVTGQSFEDFVEQRIFRKCGMDSSFIYNAGKDKEAWNRGVVGYRKSGRKAPWHYQNGVVGDKGVYSNVRELLAFDSALHSGMLLNDSVLGLVFLPRHKELNADDNYGLGWRIKEYRDRKIVYHGGWWKGFKTYLIHDSKGDNTIIILTNRLDEFFSVKRLCDMVPQH